MQPSRNTQWNRIRLTQTAQEAGVLTSGGSGSPWGCCGKCLLWGGTASINSVFALRTQMLPPPPHTHLPGLQKQGLPCCRPFRTVSSSPPPATPQTSFDKYSWITRDGPKGQGPETLSAFYLRALKSTLCFWGSRQASRHTKAALFLHMWRLLIRIDDFFFIVAADKLVCRVPFC